MSTEFKPAIRKYQGKVYEAQELECGCRGCSFIENPTKTSCRKCSPHERPDSKHIIWVGAQEGKKA
jgi:hypothetical protein